MNLYKTSITLISKEGSRADIEGSPKLIKEIIETFEAKDYGYNGGTGCYVEGYTPYMARAMQIEQNSRDRALELVEEGMVSAEDMLTAALKYMSTDDVTNMLDANELSDRFMIEEL